MGERTFEMRTVGVDYICDDCNTGAMEQTGMMLLSDPPQWPHKCNHCGATKNFYQKYPTVRWERIPHEDAELELHNKGECDELGSVGRTR